MELSNDEVLKEKVKHGTQSFPLQIYHDIEFYDKGLIFYSHWHEEAEILYVVEGELELVVDDVSIFAKTNTVILIPPNLLHTAYQCNHKNVNLHPSSFIKTL